MTARLCARHGCGKPLVTQPPASMPRALRAGFLRALADDPFCSRTCCQQWYGVGVDETPVQRAARERAEAVA